MDDDKVEEIIFILVLIIGLIIIVYAFTHPVGYEDIMNIPMKKYIAHEQMIFP